MEPQTDSHHKPRGRSVHSLAEQFCRDYRGLATRLLETSRVELDEYINLQHSLGTVESTGGFTVDPTQAMDKLSRFLLTDDSHALLKLIQGCVGWGGQEIWTQAGAHDLTLYCTMGGAREAIHCVRDRFQSIFVGIEDAPERDILLGLCHLLCLKPESISLSRWAEGELEGWETLAGQPPQRIRRYPKGMETGLGIHIYLPSHSPKLKIDSSKWCKRVFFCPCPIHAQGYLLGARGEAPFVLARAMLEYHRVGRDPIHGQIAPRWRGRAAVNLGAQLGWQSWENGKELANSQMRVIGWPPRAYPPATFTASSSGLLEKMANLFQAPLPFCSGCLYLDRKRSNAPQTATVLPIKRGVLLDALEIKLPAPAALVVLPCDDLATDLSTTKIRDDCRADVIHRALDLVKEGLQICQANSQHLPLEHDWREPRSFVIVGVSVFLSVAAGALTGFMPLLWPGPVLAGLLGRELEKHWTGGQRKAELLQVLHDDIGHLSEQISCEPSPLMQSELCPACRTELKELPLGELHPRLCHACGGLWLTRVEAETLLRLPQVPRALLHSHATLPIPTERLPEGQRLCADCVTLLETRNVDGVVLDGCPTCRGVFVETGELEALRSRV